MIPVSLFRVEKILIFENDKKNIFIWEKSPIIKYNYSHTGNTNKLLALMNFQNVF